MAEYTDTERLDWVIRNAPEFEEGFLRIWLGSSTAPSGVSGYHITNGSSARECIDQALDGNFISID